MKRHDFLKDGYFVREEIQRDMFGALKKYWFAVWVNDDGDVLAEVAVTVRVGIASTHDNPVEVVISAGRPTRGGVYEWPLESILGPGDGRNRAMADPPKYVREWIGQHGEALRLWRAFMIQYHK